MTIPPEIQKLAEEMAQLADDNLYMLPNQKAKSDWEIISDTLALPQLLMCVEALRVTKKTLSKLNHQDLLVQIQSLQSCTREALTAYDEATKGKT